MLRVQISKKGASATFKLTIISNNSKAKGLQYSKIYKIKKKIFDFKNVLSENRSDSSSMPR